MTAIEDLNAAVTTLATNFATLDAAIQTEVTTLGLALKASNDVAVEAAAKNISTLANKMAADSVALAASVVPPPVAGVTPVDPPAPLPVDSAAPAA